MLPEEQFTKVSIVCKCGQEGCLGKKTGIMILYFGKTDREWELADEIQDLLAQEGIKLRDVESRADPAIRFGETLEILVQVLDSLEKEPSEPDVPTDVPTIVWPEALGD